MQKKHLNDFIINYKINSNLSMTICPTEMPMFLILLISIESDVTHTERVRIIL